MLVLAPSTLQEAVDLTYRAFDLADKYRNPVCLLLDGFIGTMMEPVELPEAKGEEELQKIRASKAWIAGSGVRTGEPHHVLCGAGLNVKFNQEELNIRDAAMYEVWERDEVEYEEGYTDDAELILTAYGISGRIIKSAVNVLRSEGYKVGFIRPIKVNPFPDEPYGKLDYSRIRAVLCAEMSIPAQFAIDVKNAIRGRAEVDTVLSSGGTVLDRDRVIEKSKTLLKNRTEGGKNNE